MQYGFRTLRISSKRSAYAWRAVFDDLIERDLRRPEFFIVDGPPGLDKAIAAGWDDVPVQRCSVHKHWNLVVHAPSACMTRSPRLQRMIYAATREELEVHRKAFVNGGSNTAPSPTAWRKRATLVRLRRRRLADLATKSIDQLTDLAA